MKKKSESIIGIVQIMIIIVLVGVLVALFGYYAFLQVNGKHSRLLYFPESEQSAFLNDSKSPSSKRENIYLVPEFIGFSLDGRRCFCGFDDINRDPVIESANVVLRHILKEKLSFLKREFDSEEERKEYFEKLYGERDYIFMSYTSDIPVDVLSPVLINESSQHAFLFKTLTIIQNNDESLAVFCNTLGDVHEFLFDGTDLFNIGDFSAYIDIAGTLLFEFEKDYCVFPCALVSKSVRTSCINVDAPAFGEDERKNIMRTFNVNPDNSSVYESDKGVITYIDGTKEISFLDDNIVEYVAYENQNDLNKISGHNPQDIAFSFYDYVKASYNIVGMLDYDYFNQDANVGLISVEFSENVLTFKFGYFIDGIVMDTSNRFNEISMSFSDNSLKHLKVRMVGYEKNQETSSLLSQKLFYNIEKENFKIGFSGFGAAYTEESNDSEEQYISNWLLKRNN